MQRSAVHNVLMIGPPGAGKILLARAMPGILPRMTIDEDLDVPRIYSVAIRGGWRRPASASGIGFR
jgi:predicted ATPase with chaperone activity